MWRVGFNPGAGLLAVLDQDEVLQVRDMYGFPGLKNYKKISKNNKYDKVQIW